MVWTQKLRRRRERAEPSPDEDPTRDDALAQARLGRLTERGRLERASYPEPPAPPAEPGGIRKLFWAPDELVELD